MHHALLSFLGLAPAILALPSVFPPVQVGQSVIPPDTLYYYRYNRIPLSLYGNELMTETFRHSEAMMSNMIKDFTCIANDESICPSERWYCNSEKNKCMQKALIGETCRSDDACFSGYCRSRCSIRPGHFGAGCTDDNQCSSGLVCRRDSHHQNELRCLDRSDNGYGLACTSHSDCESPLSCNDVGFGWTQKMCSRTKDLTHLTHRTVALSCFKDEDFCGGDEQCCSGNCRRTITSYMPRCVATA